MASGKTYVLAALCCLVILSTFISKTDSASCCLRYTKRRLACNQMLGYTIQTINKSCDIHAIIFHRSGRFICADPLSKNTQEVMKCLDERRRKTEEILSNKE